MELAVNITRPNTKIDTYTPRTFVIGDIHSTYLALADLIDKIGLREKDTLIFLGDYIDGYPDPVNTIKYIIDLSSQYNVIKIKGNHDLFLEKYLKTGIPPYGWFINGGKTTFNQVKSYLKNNPQEYDLFMDFFNSLHNYYIDDNNNLFIHGGFDYKKSLYENKRFYGEEIFYNDRELVQKAFNLHNSNKNKVNFLPTQEMFKEIFIGHTTTEIYDKKEYKPLNFLNVWLLDTGAGWTGKLCAMDINTKEYWMSDFTSIYYPTWQHD